MRSSIQTGGPTTLANGALVHKHCHPKSQKEVAAFAEKWKDKIASGALDVRLMTAKQAKDELFRDLTEIPEANLLRIESRAMIGSILRGFFGQQRPKLLREDSRACLQKISQRDMRTRRSSRRSESA